MLTWVGVLFAVYWPIFSVCSLDSLVACSRLYGVQESSIYDIYKHYRQVRHHIVRETLFLLTSKTIRDLRKLTQDMSVPQFKRKKNIDRGP
jgi:hypothetical protein